MASRAEIRLSIVSLVHRHGESVENVIARAQSLEDWVYREDKAPRAVGAPPSAPEGETSESAPDAESAGQATPNPKRNQSQRS